MVDDEKYGGEKHASYRCKLQFKWLERERATKRIEQLGEEGATTGSHHGCGRHHGPW